MHTRRGPGWGVGEAEGCLPQAAPLTPGPSCSWAPPKIALCPPRPRPVWWGQKSSCLAESHTSPRRWSCPGRQVSSGFFSLRVPRQCRLRCLGAEEEMPTISPSKEQPQGRSRVGPWGSSGTPVWASTTHPGSCHPTRTGPGCQPASQKANGWSDVTFRVPRADPLPAPWPQILASRKKSFISFSSSSLTKH